MDQETIDRLAKLIVSVAKQRPQKQISLTMTNLPEIDPNARALCSDILGKISLNQKKLAIQKIQLAAAQCKVESTPKDSEKVFDAIKALV